MTHEKAQRWHKIKNHALNWEMGRLNLEYRKKKNGSERKTSWSELKSYGRARTWGWKLFSCNYVLSLRSQYRFEDYTMKKTVQRGLFWVTLHAVKAQREWPSPWTVLCSTCLSSPERLVKESRRENKLLRRKIQKNVFLYSYAERPLEKMNEIEVSLLLVEKKN